MTASVLSVKSRIRAASSALKSSSFCMSRSRARRATSYLSFSGAKPVVNSVISLPFVLDGAGHQPGRLRDRRHFVNISICPFFVLLCVVAGCGSGISGTDPGKLAANVGAISCATDDYYIENQLDHSKTRIYSCDMGTHEICVTEEGGIDRNVTAEVKLLFANSLSGGKPVCVGG